MTTDELLLFHKNKSDEIPCKLEPAEDPSSMEKYLDNEAPPQRRVGYFSNKCRFSP